MKSLFTTIGLIVATANVSAAESWVKVSESKETVYDVKAGSLERTATDRGNEPIIAFLVRSKDKKSGTTEFEKNYVKLSDCKVGYGKLVTTDLNGKAKYSSDFVLDGGNVASTLAGTLCSLAVYKDPEAPADFESKSGQ